MQVELVFRVVFGPGHLLKPVGLRVDELCILWNWLVRVPEGGKQKMDQIITQGPGGITALSKSSTRL